MFLYRLCNRKLTQKTMNTRKFPGPMKANEAGRMSFRSCVACFEGLSMMYVSIFNLVYVERAAPICTSSDSDNQFLLLNEEIKKYV